MALKSRVNEGDAAEFAELAVLAELAEWAGRQIGGLLAEVEEGGAVEGLAVKNDGGDAAGVPDVSGGVGIEDEDVGAATGCDEAKLVPAELERVVVGGSGEGFARRQAETDKQLKLGVK